MIERKKSFRGTGERSFTPGVICGLLLTFALHAGLARAAPGVTEYQIKAAYLYHFTQFVEWPPAAFASPDKAFRVCVLGEAPFGTQLEPLTERAYDSHPIVLAYPRAARAARDCYLLYIGSSEAGREVAILEALAGAPVLTVSSLPGFVDRGGAIGFVRVGNRVRFEINRAAGKRAGLSYSAKLLEVAIRIVGEAPRGERP